MSEKDTLLPELYLQDDLFVCDVADAVLKDDMLSMEHPFFSLSKVPDKRIRRYENGRNWLEITPSAKGLATIYDKDILIFCISQLIAAMKAGRPISREIKIQSADLLRFTNRHAGGEQYEMLSDALVRLRGTTIQTNLIAEDTEQRSGFGLIEEYTVERVKKTGHISAMTVTLSTWVFKAIKNHEVLTLHRDYFRLRKPTERRVYEIARKHCGRQDEWTISAELLQKKCGSKASKKEFNRGLRVLALGNHLPDYTVTLEGDNVIFRNRTTWKPKPEIIYPTLDPETYHDAKTVAPNYDVYWLEAEWRNWWADSGMPELHHPDKAFVQFCRMRHQRNPNP